MKKVISIIFVLGCWVIFGTEIMAVEAKPIKGTFLMTDFSYRTAGEWDEYFNDLKSVGMDTIVLSSVGEVNKADNCNGAYIYSSSVFDKSSWFSTPVGQMVLIAARKNKFHVFLGLAGSGKCIKNYDSVDQKTLIDYSKKMIEDIKKFYEDQGWDWSDGQVSGFYINQELDVRKFSGTTAWNEYVRLYKDLSAGIKSIYPEKKILLSPYLFEEDAYQTIYDNIYFAAKNWQIDIYAPQDSIGTFKTKTFSSDREHFRALHDAIVRVNQETGKKVEAWANVESFTCPDKSCASASIFPPTNFKTLKWQIRAVDDLVSNIITWTHQWSLATIPLLNDYGYYKPELAVQRKSFYMEYVNKPIILYPFVWSSNYVIKGYNFGEVGELVRVFVHNNGKKYQVVTSVRNTNDPGKTYSELIMPLSSLSGFVSGSETEVAVQKRNGYVSYYRSSNPDTLDEPSFPEIDSWPSATVIPTATLTIAPTTMPTAIATIIPTETITNKVLGDADGDGKARLNDFSIWKEEFLLGEFGTKIDTKWLADFDSDGKVSINDSSIWKENFIKGL